MPAVTKTRRSAFGWPNDVNWHTELAGYRAAHEDADPVPRPGRESDRKNSVCLHRNFGASAEIAVLLKNGAGRCLKLVRRMW